MQYFLGVINEYLFLSLAITSTPFKARLVEIGYETVLIQHPNHRKVDAGAIV
jgi:hypothetical protein